MNKYIKKQIKKAAQAYAPVYLQNNWSWFNIPGDGIPTEKDIHKSLTGYYKELKKSKGHAIGSGRLMVYRDCDKEFHFYLEA